MSESQRWYDPIRKEFDASFNDTWAPRLARFSHELPTKAAATKFHLPHKDVPPAWFNGNLTAMKPGEWVLVVSNNPHGPGIGPTLPLADADASREGWWNHLHTVNPDGANWGRPGVFPKVIDLAAAARGVDVSAGPGASDDFAAERMLVIEFCPYASQTWPTIQWDPTMKQLAQETEGIRRYARRIRGLLFEYGQPKAVLCLGQEATWDVKDKQFGEDRMFRMNVELKSRPGEFTALYQGTYQPKNGPPFEVIGFQEVPWGPKHHDVRREIVAAYGRDGADSGAFQRFSRDPYSWENRPPSR